MNTEVYRFEARHNDQAVVIRVLHSDVVSRDRSGLPRFPLAIYETIDGRKVGRIDKGRYSVDDLPGIEWTSSDPLAP